MERMEYGGKTYFRMEHKGKAYLLEELSVEDVKKSLGYLGVDPFKVLGRACAIEPVARVHYGDDGWPSATLGSVAVLRHWRFSPTTGEPWEALPELWVLLDGQMHRGLMRHFLYLPDLGELNPLVEVGRAAFERAEKEYDANEKYDANEGQRERASVSA